MEQMSPLDNSVSRDEGGRTQANAMAIVRVFSSIRARLMSGFGLTSFGGRRNYNKIFGWDDTISPENMLYMYNRGGIASRVVDSYPNTTWASPPILWAPGDDAWTLEWATLVDKWDLWQALHRLDKLSGLGHYGILLLGTDKPGLDKPLTSATDLIYAQPYGETSVKIKQYETDSTSPNFGKPSVYRVYPDNLNSLTGKGGYGAPNGGVTRTSFDVHASRVIHVAKGILEDEVFGIPDMAAVWDYLTDLRKVVGSAAESYWISANRGLQANVDKEMQLSFEDQAALQDEIQNFYDGFQRFIRTKGVKMETLTNDLADPTGPFNVLITLVSGTKGIPKRILIGSEAGQLASAQDKGNWAERIEEYRALTAEPRIIKPFLRKALALGLIRPPKDGATIKILWPDAYRMNPLERGQTAAQTGRVLSYIVKLLESKSEGVRDLMNREEMRSLLGLSTDNRVLRDEPNP